MSWFSSKSETTTPATGTQAHFDGAANAPNFFPVTSTHSGFGALTPEDTTWVCKTSGGFQAETQVWYSILGDGSLLLVQVIFSFIGVWPIPATAQMTFKLYSPKTRTQTWKSVTTSGFKTDGRGCKSSDFEIIHQGSPAAGEPETYKITANLDKTVQLSLVFTRPAGSPGFKYGEGIGAGFSTFGKDKSEGKRDGIVVHRFMPLMTSEGSLVIDGKVIDAKGDATFIHAIQGMRPNEIASRWNFAYFTSGGGQEESKFGAVRAVQMEFETTDAYGAQGANSGRIKCNVGAIYLSSAATQPIIVTGQTHPGGYPALSTSISKATHTAVTKEEDKDTGYYPPTGLKFEWEGESREKAGEIVKASVEVATGTTPLEGPGGLIEKVNVLAEIPYIIRKALAAVTGASPYLYQYLNPATLNVTVGEEEVVPVKGWMFNEATFISA